MFTRDKSYELTVFALGFSSIAVQVVLVREFLSVFYGNELVIGIILFNWMILTGIGSLLGRSNKKFHSEKKVILLLIISIAIFPLLIAFSLNYFRNIIFPVGVVLNINEIFLLSTLLLLPFCITSGFSFTFLASSISKYSSANLIDKVYALESFGSVVGGLLMSLLLTFLLSNVHILILLLIFNLSVALILSFSWQFRYIQIFILFIAICITTTNYFLNYDKVFKKFLYFGQPVEHSINTPYGNLVVTRTEHQKNVFENSLLLFSTGDPISNEETVHYAMSQREHANKVLLISGGISGTFDEIFKYKIQKIDYVELNPFIIELGKKYFNLSKYLQDSNYHKLINLKTIDARIYLRNTNEIYDIILINLPEPSTAQINRYYTNEFLLELKKKLDTNGVVSYSLVSSADYLSKEARMLKSVIYNTLRKNFKNVLIIPGYRDYFICSDGKLDIDIPSLVEGKKIENLYVNKYYLDAEILKQRSIFIQKNLNESEKINTDFKPISYYQQIILWSSQFNINYQYIIIGLLILVIIIVSRLNVVSYGMFAGGFAAAGMETILLISFQILYGYVYQIMGVIIAIFMLGLSFGAGVQRKFVIKISLRKYSIIQLLIGLASVVTTILIIMMNRYEVSTFFLQGLFMVMTFTIAFLVGLEFAMAVKLRQGFYSRIASEIYGVDLIGSAIGTLVTAVFLFPVLGLLYSGFIICGLNLLGSFVSYYKTR